MSNNFSENDQPWAQAGESARTALPGREAWSSSQQAGQFVQPGQGGLLGGALGNVRQAIEGQIGQAIDHYASHVPGGEKYTPQAKQAISSIIDGLQRQLENEASSRMGGFGSTVFGNNPGNQGSQGGQSGQGGESPL